MQHPIRVLVAEDCADTAEVLAHLLRLWGHEARTVRDGDLVVEAALDYRPDVVLLDIAMPGRNGFEVARALRQEALLDRTVLVAVTGYAQEEYRRWSREAGFDHYLLKPFEPESLKALLATVSNGARPGRASPGAAALAAVFAGLALFSAS